MLDLPYGELRICAEVTPTIINSQVVPRHKNSGMAALEQLAMDGRLTVRVEDAAAICCAAAPLGPLRTVPSW